MRQAAAIALGQTGHAKVKTNIKKNTLSHFVELYRNSLYYCLIYTYISMYIHVCIYSQMIHNEIANRLSNTEEAVRLDALKKVCTETHFYSVH